MQFTQTFRSKAKRCTALFCLIVGTLTASRSAICAQEEFDPSAVDRFDGREWHGLRLDSSSTDEVKRKYRTGKGAFRPEAMVLLQPRGSDVNVQTLFDGRGGSSRLVGFRLAYKGEGPDIRQLAQGLDADPEILYAERRYSDWYIKAFRRSGVLACVVREGDDEFVALVLLTTPNRASDLLRGFSKRRTPIGDLKRDFNPNDVRAKFTSILVSMDQNGLRVDDPEDLKEDIRRDIRAFSGSANLQYGDGNGLYSVRITLDKPKEKEGSVTVSITATGDAPFGSLTTSGFAYKTFDRGLFGSVNVSRSVIMDAYRDAKFQAGIAFTTRIRQGMPSSPKAYREQAWNSLANGAIR